MIAAHLASREREGGISHGIVLAVSLALAITAGLASILFRPRPMEPAPADHRAFPPGVRPEAAGAPAPPEPTAPPSAAPGGKSVALPADAPSGAFMAEAEDPLTKLQRAFPALEWAAWDEITTALLGEGSAKRLPRALRALVLDLAGTVPTTAGTGPGELTHPVVLSRILDEVLAGSGERLTPAQREQVASLANRVAEELEDVAAALASRPRLASTVAEVEVKLGFIEDLGRVLDAEQRAFLERMVAGDAGEGAPLSPLRLIEAHELDPGPDADAFRRDIAAELARAFEIDPALARALAVKLHGGLAPLLDGSASELSPPERALIAARAQARILEELLRAPGLSTEARQRALEARAVAVPRARGSGAR